MKFKFDREIYEKTIPKYSPNNRFLLKITYTNEIIGNNDSSDRTIKYQTFEMDESLLLQYIKCINNEEYSFFKTFRYLIIKNEIKAINYNEIELCIEKYCINKEIFNSNDLCSANIILLFSLCLNLLSDMYDCQQLLALIIQDAFFSRRYYSILLSIIFKLFQISKNKYSGKTARSTLCFYSCINSFRNINLVPNEELINIINKFNKIEYSQFQFEDIALMIKKNKDLDIFEQYIKKRKTNAFIYPINNFNKERFINEKTILDYINKHSISEIKFQNNTIIVPEIRFRNKRFNYVSIFYSQKMLLHNLNEEFEKYIKNIDDRKIISDFILNSCMNIILYLRNSIYFLNKEDIMRVVSYIFFLLMDKLSELKEIKNQLDKTNK